MLRFIVPFRVHNAGWILVALCIVFGFQLGGWTLGLPIGLLLIVSLLLHEAGHMLVALWFRVPVYEFGIRLGGAYNRRERATRRRDELLISAAGPFANLLLVIPLLFFHRLGALMAACNLVLGVVNLLPLPTSDGLRILRTLWSFTTPRALVPATGQGSQG